MKVPYFLRVLLENSVIGKKTEKRIEMEMID
jgi:hypothetical protein